jgi:hypothetical protein
VVLFFEWNVSSTKIIKYIYIKDRGEELIIILGRIIVIMRKT